MTQGLNLLLETRGLLLALLALLLCWLSNAGSFNAVTEEPMEGLLFVDQVTSALQAVPLQPLRSQSWWRLKTMTGLPPSWPLPSKRSSNNTTR